MRWSALAPMHAGLEAMHAAAGPEACLSGWREPAQVSTLLQAPAAGQRFSHALAINQSRQLFIVLCTPKLERFFLNYSLEDSSK